MAVHPHGEHSCYCPSCGYQETVGASERCNQRSCPYDGTRLRAVDTGERRISADVSASTGLLFLLGLVGGVGALIYLARSQSKEE